MNKEQTITGIIRGTGACVPKRVLDNNEIAGFVDTSDEWIRERTGVKRRRIVESETTVSMADRKSTRLNSSHNVASRMPSSA